MRTAQAPVLDEMCIAKSSLLTCEMGVQTYVLTGCVCRLHVQISLGPTVEPPPPPRVGSSQPQWLSLCVLPPGTSQIWTPVGDQRAVSPEARGGGGEMLAS